MTAASPAPDVSAKAPGMEAPLATLANCHERGARQCAALSGLAQHLAAKGADEEARALATGVLRYFDKAAKDHYADEEIDLFPALLDATAAADAQCLRALIEGLTAEHRSLESAWARVRDELTAVAAGASAQLPAAGVAALVGHYEQHMTREDEELMPLAARLLGAAELARMGLAMAARRGIDGPKPAPGSPVSAQS